MAPCKAPVFNGVVTPPTSGNPITIILTTIVLGIVGAAICVPIGLFYLIAIIFWTLLSPFIPGANCKRKQALFQLRHCIFGNQDPNITL
jgi:hypothetical protein